MINLDYGITYISGVGGASYWEGQDAHIYVIVAYNKDTNSIDTFLAIAGNEHYAKEGIVKQFDLDLKGFQVISVTSLYDMLKKLEVSLG